MASRMFGTPDASERASLNMDYCGVYKFIHIFVLRMEFCWVVVAFSIGNTRSDMHAHTCRTV